MSAGLVRFADCSLLSLCIDDIFINIIDIWISYGAPDWCVLRTVLLSLCIDDIFITVIITCGIILDIISTVLLKPRVPLWRASRGSAVILGLRATWGVVFLFRMGSFCVVLCPGIITLVLVLVLVGRFIADISVKAAIASFNLLPVFEKGFAASDGFVKPSVNSSIDAVALSDEAVACMVYFSGRNTTVSETLVPLVLGI
jgi:hypothetical protein